MSGSALAVRREPTALDMINQQLEEKRTSIEQVLVAGLDFDRLKSVTLEAITRQPKLLQCTVPSLIRAIHQSAQLGLEPSGLLGSAYLVPYRNKRSGKLEAQLIVGYRGLIELADRTAGIQIEADVVYPEDVFEYSKGTDPRLTHIPSLEADRVDPKKITHAYAVAFHPAWTKPKIVVMTRAQIERIERRAQRGTDSPWNSDWAAMARKTPIRQMGNQMPLRVQRLFEQVFDREDVIDRTGLPATTPAIASRTAEVRGRLAERAAQRRTKPASSDAVTGAAQETTQADGDVEASSEAAGPGVRGRRGRSAGPSASQGAVVDSTPPAAPSPAAFSKEEVDEILDGESQEIPWPEGTR